MKTSFRLHLLASALCASSRRLLLSALALAPCAVCPSAWAVSATDVTSFDLFQTQFYTQSSSAQPVTPAGYIFAARIFTDAPLAGATSNLLTPASQNYSLGTAGSTFIHREDFASQVALSATYPAGNYTFSLDNGDLIPSSQSGTLVEPVTALYPLSVPYFTNYAAFSNLPADQDFLLTWNSFTTNPSAPLSQIFLLIVDHTTGDSETLNQFFADSSTTSFNIPANTLHAGDNYSATLYFSSRTAYLAAWSGGATGLVGFDSATIASVAPVPEPATGAFLFGLFSIGMLLLRRHATAPFRPRF